MIQLDNITKQYGNQTVLKNVNAHFKKGLVYGIVGANGSGKTTLFNCITGLEKYEGKITSDYEKLKDHIGFLSTEPYFFSKITGKEYIQFLLNSRKEDVPNIEEQNIFDLPLQQYASTYSTGMKKKLALTAILLQKNDCFILDEPFNGVDIQSNALIIEIIHKLKSLGKTVLLSSHIFSTLATVCDEIYVLEKGQFVNSVAKNDFAKLEEELKDFAIGNLVEKLKLE